VGATDRGGYHGHGSPPSPGVISFSSWLFGSYVILSILCFDFVFKGWVLAVKEGIHSTIIILTVVSKSIRDHHWEYWKKNQGEARA